MHRPVFLTTGLAGRGLDHVLTGMSGFGHSRASEFIVLDADTWRNRLDMSSTTVQLYEQYSRLNWSIPSSIGMQMQHAMSTVYKNDMYMLYITLSPIHHPAVCTVQPHELEHTIHVITPSPIHPYLEQVHVAADG